MAINNSNLTRNNWMKQIIVTVTPGAWLSELILLMGLVLSLPHEIIMYRTSVFMQGVSFIFKDDKNNLKGNE